MPRVRVAGLLTIDDKVVFVRHRSFNARYHLLPGGGVEFGETLEDALRREIAEETGLSVTVGDPLFISDTIDPNGRRHVINITFACSVAGGSLSVPDEPRIEAIDLVAPADLGDLDMRPPMAAEIGRALADGAFGTAAYIGSRYKPDI